MQDPLSSIPHQTYQAHRAAKNPQSAPPLPGQSRPLSGGVTLSTAGKPPAPAAAATIEAAPELRDFKKEATAFVPAALKRKKATAGATSKINAAPKAGSEEPEAPAAARPDLMSTLKQNLGSAVSMPPKVADVKSSAAKPKDDYDKFLDEMGDILGPKT